VLLGWGLVGTVTELGRSVDPFEVDLLRRPPVGLGEHGLAESHDTLLDTWNGTLEENKVVRDLAVTDETTHSDDRVSCVNGSKRWTEKLTG